MSADEPAPPKLVPRQADVLRPSPEAGARSRAAGPGTLDQTLRRDVSAAGRRASRLDRFDEAEPSDGDGDGPEPHFEGLFTRQYEPMVRVAFLMLGSRSEAEDAVQDAFARVQLRWARLDNPGGYLRRCVVNRSYDTLRRRRLEQRLRLARRTETTELGADELSDALTVLPPKRRAAVVLRYYAGMREHEIAEVLGVRPGTVKSMLHRALAQLREVIER